jgi:phosphoribosylanthranilate isomerase
VTRVPHVAVKLCGFTRPGDAAFAVGEGADYLGLNLWPGSKRHVTVERAATIAAAARAAGAVRLVGLFVNQPEDEIVAAAAALALDVVQLHGDEPPAMVASLAARGLTVWKAHAIGSAADIAALASWPAAAHLLDAPSAGRGGSGTRFDWSLAASAPPPIVLAGGLTPANVAAAIAQVHPFAVDVASGVESAPGQKDPALVRAFLAAARAS